MGLINKKDITLWKDLKVGQEQGKITSLRFLSLVIPGAFNDEFDFDKEKLLKIIIKQN